VADAGAATCDSSALPAEIAPACPTLIPGFGLAPVVRCWGTNATGSGVLQVDKALAKTM
jgi:hypothetical protein